MFILLKQNSAPTFKFQTRCKSWSIICRQLLFCLSFILVRMAKKVSKAPTKINGTKIPPKDSSQLPCVRVPLFVWHLPLQMQWPLQLYAVVKTVHTSWIRGEGGWSILFAWELSLWPIVAREYIFEKKMKPQWLLTQGWACYCSMYCKWVCVRIVMKVNCYKTSSLLKDSAQFAKCEEGSTCDFITKNKKLSADVYKYLVGPATDQKAMSF